MASGWPALPYEEWRATRDTLHAHTQVLGKLATALAPPEPQLQHTALRLSARGWETLPLPAPDGSGALVVALDLHSYEAVAEHSDGRVRRVPLTPDRPVRAVTREVLAAVRELGGPVAIDPRWGSFDLSVGLFSGRPAQAPSADFIMRNSMDAEEVAVGWWPGDARYPRAAFYAYAHPAPEELATATLAPAAAHWDGTLGEFILDWDDIRDGPDPHGAALDFARSAVRHACAVCGWDPRLSASADGTPPPVA